MQPFEPILPWSVGPSYPHWSDLLRDGTRVLVRPVTRHDAVREAAFIESLSPRSRRYRFLGQVAHPGADLVRLLTDIDYQDQVAFCAVEAGNPNESFIGVSRYSATHDGTSCECAVTVRDDWHHRGLGTLLMKHLVEVAKARGILCMYSFDAAENDEMRELADYLGFSRRIDRNDATLAVHSLWLGG